MSELRRRRQRLAALIGSSNHRGEPRELTGREAATLYVGRTHLVIPIDERSSIQAKLANILAGIFGSNLAVISTMPAVDRRLPRPRLSVVYPHSRLEAERCYSPLLLCFTRDTEENRRVIDATISLIGATKGGTVDGRLTTFGERGAVLFFDCGSELIEATAVVLTMLQTLHEGRADDLSLQ